MQNLRRLFCTSLIITLFNAAIVFPQQEGLSSKIVVEGQKLTFDPKTCTQGRGLFYWGLGSCAVKMLGHQNNDCVFEYTAEVEGGHSVYLVKVPKDSGLVTIKEGIVKNGGSSYSGIITSFSLDQAKLLRRGHFATHWQVQVGDTNEFIEFGPAERRSEMEPQKGDQVKIRCIIFSSQQFQRPMPNAVRKPTVEFTVGSGQGWPWLETALEDLTVGDSRKVTLPYKIADGVKSWLPKAADKLTTLYIEIRLVNLERK